MLKVPNGRTRRSYLFTSFEVEATSRCEVNKKVERMLNDADGVQLVREDGTFARRWREVPRVSRPVPSFKVNSSITSHAYPPE